MFIMEDKGGLRFDGHSRFEKAGHEVGVTSKTFEENNYTQNPH
jgi:hypothetical protein